MGERSDRLLPRLMATLNTLENDAEIVETVRRIRALSGSGAVPFSGGAPVTPPPRDTVSLTHPERKTAMRLRGLGLLLRLRDPTDPDVEVAVRRVELSLIHGGLVDRLDLLATLGHLRDLLGAVDDDLPAHDAGGTYYERSAGRVQEQLRDSMAELWNRTRR